MRTAVALSPFRRTCQYCGVRAVAQGGEHGGRAAFTDAAGRVSWRPERTADAMPAYAMNAFHERTCSARPPEPTAWSPNP